MCAWSYLSSAPGSSDKSWVRLRIGDTSTGDQLLQDEEIQAALDSEGNKHLAAAVCADMVGAYFARKVDKTVGKLSISMAQASEHYFKLGARLRQEIVMSAGPWAGGISEADKDSAESDSDRVEPAFRVGQFDVPGTFDASSS